MKKLNITACGLILAAAMTITSCQDIVTYDEGYDDGMASHGAPSITAIYNAEDTEMNSPLTGGAFEDMIKLTGENLSYVKKITLNDVEVPLNEVYATAEAAYFPIPRVVPTEVNNKLYYETELGNTSVDFTVSVPEVNIIGLYNEYALPGSSVRVCGDYFDLYGFGSENASSTITMNGVELEVDSLTEQYMSIVIPQNATDNSTIVFTWESSNGMKSVSVPYRNNANILWNLDTPDAYGFWAGTELITDGADENAPEPLNGSYFRINGSYGAWSWNNLLCGGCDFPAEAAANPSDYWFKFEVNSASGNPFYDSGSAGYLIQLNGGQYAWNPSATGSFNTYGNWCTVRLELSDVATNGINSGWNNLFWIMQPNSDWNVDHSFANIRIEKK
ncbi:MAG: glycan-binding surface protein [Bacteroidales bacterium]|nr:glycan-binding surface protein [Bacteroidales bacterium]